jgi:hypothetical protein
MYAVVFGGGGDASLGFLPTRKDASENTGECARGLDSYAAFLA